MRSTTATQLAERVAAWESQSTALRGKSARHVQAAQLAFAEDVLRLYQAEVTFLVGEVETLAAAKQALAPPEDFTPSDVRRRLLEDRVHELENTLQRTRSEADALRAKAFEVEKRVDEERRQQLLTLQRRYEGRLHHAQDVISATTLDGSALNRSATQASASIVDALQREVEGLRSELSAERSIRAAAERRADDLSHRLDVAYSEVTSLKFINDAGCPDGIDEAVAATSEAASRFRRRHIAIMQLVTSLSLALADGDGPIPAVAPPLPTSTPIPPNLLPSEQLAANVMQLLRVIDTMHGDLSDTLSKTKSEWTGNLSRLRTELADREVRIQHESARAEELAVHLAARLDSLTSERDTAVLSRDRMRAAMTEQRAEFRPPMRSVAVQTTNSETAPSERHTLRPH